MEKNGNARTTESLRNLRTCDAGSESDFLPAYENSWAVVVGINNYIHFDQLDNALKDALGIAEVLVTRLDFPRDNVFLALDPKPDPSTLPYILGSNVRSASKADIEDLLLNVLPEKAGKNDRVLVFYAGHGDERDPVPGYDKPGAFLIPADAEHGKWSTYIEWKMVHRAGNEFCKAKHIFYVLDACYSGIVSMRDASEPPREMRDALTNSSRQALAAGTSRQVVADAGREGHSPFTWHLIQGLRGDAVNLERSTEGSIISAHDLIGYVRRKVAEEDSAEQTPSGGSIGGHGGGDFIFTSPLIGFSSQEHFQLAVGLVELGLRSGEWSCFESAARNLQYAIQLKHMAGEDAAELEEWLGRALLLAGSVEALPTLDKAAAQGRTTALLYLGVAYAWRGNVDAACQSLKSFAERLPNHADAAWAAAYVRQLRETGGKRKYALLVGVDKMGYMPGSQLQGCVNDVLSVKALLEEVYGFDPANIKTLTDEQATASNITSGLENLAAVARPQDTVVFHYSGHKTWVAATETSTTSDSIWQLMPYDTRAMSEQWENTITGPQLHALLTKISARDKLFIGGQEVYPDHDPSTETGGYRLFAPTLRGQNELETVIDGDSHGPSIYHLCKVVRQSTKISTESAGEIVREVKRTLNASKYEQTPQYFGSPSAPLLPWQPRGPEPDFLALHEFGDRREYAALDLPALEEWEARLEALGIISHPRAWLSCARAWLSHKQSARAVESATKALQQPGCDEGEARLLLCEAHLEARELETATEYARTLPRDLAPAESDALIEQITQLSSPRRRALIVAIDKYPKAIGINLEGPCAEARALKSALTANCGFAISDIEVLVNEEATREAILSKFEDLLRHAKTELALFYFAGLGTNASDGRPDIVAADVQAQNPTRTFLEDLKVAALFTPGWEGNLVAIFDAGWTKFDKATLTKMAAMRVFIPNDERGHVSLPFPDLSTLDRDPTQIPQIGFATIYNGSITKIYERKATLIESLQESKRKKYQADLSTGGGLTMALVGAIQRVDTHTMTYADWIAAAASAKPHVHLQRGDARIFEDAVMLERALRSIWQLRDRNLHKTVDLLYRLTELRRGRDPDSFLDLAIARMIRNSYNDIDIANAREAVETSLMYRHQQVGERGRDALGEVFWPELFYVRGRIQFAEGAYSAAESSLGKALLQYSQLSASEFDYPDFREFLGFGAPVLQNVDMKTVCDAQLARTHYWHARAVQELIGEDLLTAVESDFREYLRLGAPFGDSERARTFLTERAKAVEISGSEGSRKTKAAKRKRTEQSSR